MSKNRNRDRQLFEEGRKIVRQFLTFLSSPLLAISAALGFNIMLGVMSRDCLANEHAAANTFEHSGGNMSNNQIMGDESKQMSNIYEFKAKSIDGEEVDLSKYKGSVMLIVNTASECGFTPQYAGLESLHEKFEARGLKVLGFPCNQFGGQEPGDSKDIAHFCQANYGVKFQMFEKVDVNGKDADPIFKYLTSSAPGILGSEVIKWNFTKFLLNKNGEIVKRFAPNVTPEDISPEIEKLL